MERLKRAWRGEERLWVVFWIYGILIGNALNFLLVFLSAQSSGIVFLTAFFIVLIYCIWILIVKWRCAFNVDWKFWGYAMRTWIVIFLAIIVPGLVIGGFLVGQDMIVAAECRQELKGYLAEGGTDEKGFLHECAVRKTNKATKTHDRIS